MVTKACSMNIPADSFILNFGGITYIKLLINSVHWNIGIGNTGKIPTRVYSEQLVCKGWAK